MSHAKREAPAVESSTAVRIDRPESLRPLLEADLVTFPTRCLRREVLDLRRNVVAWQSRLGDKGPAPPAFEALVDVVKNRTRELGELSPAKMHLRQTLGLLSRALHDRLRPVRAE